MTPCRFCFTAIVLLALAGCAGPVMRPQSPEEFSEQLESNTRLVGDVAGAYGNNQIKVEGVALVGGLANTGEDPAPSPQRGVLLNEMQIRGVVNPNKVLASPTTTMVLVRGFLPPGVQKGDHFDLEVRVPSHSATTSLRGGVILETRLTELAVLGNQIREGHLLALGEGPILVDPSATQESNPMALLHGRILSGGRALKSRSLGLVLNPDDRSIQLSSKIGEAVNRRFSLFQNGIKQGVAKPKTEEYIELTVHPRYKDNISRYLRVVRSIAIHETPGEQANRLQQLERQLMEPIMAATAALRLEAIGTEGVKTLVKGAAAEDPEVRFYAAEALAYLDNPQAVEALAKAARNEPAFRAYALAALSAMDDVGAHDELCSLLDSPSAETRYGAFRALWAMRANDPIIKGEVMGGFSYHLLKSTGPAMIHVTRSFRPEVVVFGHDQCFDTPFMLEAGNNIIVNGEGEEITVSRFAVGQPDQKRVVSRKVDDVLRTIVELGGTYPDVVQALEQAKTKHALASRFEVDAVPNSGRAYARKEAESDGGSEDAKATAAKADASDEPANPIEVSSPLPELFSKRKR